MRQADVTHSCWRLRSSQLPSVEPRSSRWKRRSRESPVSRRCATCGPIRRSTGFRRSFALRRIQPVLPVVLAVRSATEGVPAGVAVRAFLHAFVSNLVTAGVRLIPLGQTDGQRAIAELEDAVLDASERAMTATIDDLGSAALMVDLASMSHETQYTRLFRS